MRRILLVLIVSLLFGAGGAHAKDGTIIAPSFTKRIREKIQFLHKQVISNGELFTLEKRKAQKQFQIIVL